MIRMSPSTLSVLLAWLALPLGCLPAQADGSGQAAAEAGTDLADRLCAQDAHAQPPPSDEPTPAQRSALVHCDGEALLYGIGRPADPVQARLCAFVQRDEGPRTADGQSGLFDGNGLLMTIYANGLGVPRNQAVAVHLACSGIWSAPAERDWRVPHLAAMRHTSSDATFSPCDDITSGASQGACAFHDSRIAAASRTQQIDAFAARLPIRAARSFAALRTSQTAWSDARGANEVDLSGSGRAAFETEEEELQDNDFLAMLHRLEKNPPPRLGTVQLQAAQARMDTILAKILAAAPDPDDRGTVTPDGVRTAQMAWLAYRDAWETFAAAAYPGWGADGARAWVTMKRADMLSHLLPEPPDGPALP
jgi:uncharacterized protein YecT (DUF1311 family)